MKQEFITCPYCGWQEWKWPVKVATAQALCEKYNNHDLWINLECTCGMDFKARTVIYYDVQKITDADTGT